MGGLGVRPSTFDVLTIESGESAGYLLRRAQQRHTRLWSEEFGRAVTGPQFAVVTVVAGSPGLDQGTVGVLASLDKSSTADVVARLHRDGWLHIGNRADDGRRKVLTLSPLARTALVELTRRAARVQEAVLAPLGSDDERRRALRLLQAVAFAGDIPPTEEDIVAVAVGGVPVLTLRTAPGHLLRRAQQLHTMLWQEEVGGPVSAPQYSLMNALVAHPEGLDQTSAGEQTSLDKANLADIIDRLEARGWTFRRRHPADGRRRVLLVTDAARAELDRLGPAVSRVQARLLQPLPGTDRRGFLNAVRRLADAEAVTAR